jgi:CTP:molybdopterin cytidylyltransferase MocA
MPTLVMLSAGMAKRYGGCKPLAPIGIHGEAIIDLTASDAHAAGFSRIVVVVGPATGPAITYHLQRVWPRFVDTVTATQPVPLGTAHALLCARAAVGPGPFAVVNADDVYGAAALRLLAEHLRANENALVAFHLANTVLTDDPVTRGVCAADRMERLAAGSAGGGSAGSAGGGSAGSAGEAVGRLAGIAERRKVTRHDDGSFSAGDGLDPAQLDPAVLVSMNLWGFQPGIWDLIEEAVVHAHPYIGPDGSVATTDGSGGSVTSEEETLLPEVVGGALTTGRIEVALVAAPGRCVGVTHTDDLPLARAEIARMVGRGERPERLWEA